MIQRLSLVIGAAALGALSVSCALIPGSYMEGSLMHYAMLALLGFLVPCVGYQMIID